MSKKASNAKAGKSARIKSAEVESSATTSVAGSSGISTSEQTSTKGQNSAIIGYVQDVSAVKVSANNSEYFSFMIQQEDSCVKAVCFSPEKHKRQVDKKAEEGSPCKVTRYNNHPSEKNVVYVRHYANIDDVLESDVNFGYKKLEEQVPDVTNTKELIDIKVNQLLTLRGVIIIRDGEKPVAIPTKTNLTKLDGCFVDKHGSFPITIWNEHIEVVKSGQMYEIQNIRLRKYNGDLYLSSTRSTRFNLLEGVNDIPQENLEGATRCLDTEEVLCDNYIMSIDVLKFYNCVKCLKKVPFRQDSALLKCACCHSRFLVANSTKTTAVRMHLKSGESFKGSYSLFSSDLQNIIDKYNAENVDNSVSSLDSIDDDKLSEILLTRKGVKLTVKSNGSVINVHY